MPRTKGAPKTGGRQKGTKNKTTADLKNWVFQFVNENLGTFKTKFKEMETEEQITIVMKLMPFVLPKQTETKVNLDEDLSKTMKEAMDKINGMF